MKHLISYDDLDEAETSTYRVPFAAVEPQPDDKIWNYVKHKITKSPLWGINAKKQEDDNKIKRD